MAIFQFHLLNDKGESLRVFTTHTSAHLNVVREKSTDRLLIIEESGFDPEIYTLVQKVQKDDIKNTVRIRGIGSLAPVIAPLKWIPDVSLKKEDEKSTVAIFKWNSIAHGVITTILMIIAIFFPMKNTNVLKEEIVTIDLKNIMKDQLLPEDIKTEMMAQNKSIQAEQSTSKAVIKVAPRRDKSKSLLVTKTTNARKGVRGKSNLGHLANRPTSFQRMGSLGVLSNSMRGVSNGFGSGLRASDGSTGGGGYGKGAGVGRGNGTRGRGQDRGGGYAQALYGNGLIAAQVGSGGGGFGSGYGDGTPGEGGYGTKDKSKVGAGGVGHQGFGNGGQLGAGSSSFVLPVVEDVMVEGGLDEEQVEQIVARNKGQIAYCYELGLQRNSGIKGRVNAHFEIGPRGLVMVSKIASSSIKSSIVEECIANKIKNWKFPAPVGGVQVSVNYPFLLQRVSH
jgi:hypothetical protein